MVLAPPAVVLALGLAWLGSLRGATGTLEASNASLRERIRAAGPAGIGPDGGPGRAAVADSKAPFSLRELREIAPVLSAEESGGVPDLRLMIRFQSRMMTISVQEVLSMLGEIAASDIPRAHRELLENALQERLAELDPKAYLNHLADRLSGDHEESSWQMKHAFESWMEQDRSAATAWMDRMLADGKFEAKRLDGKNAMRIDFEAVLIHPMLGAEPSLAGHRIAAIPDDQRLDLFRHQQFRELPAGTEKTFAALVREYLPPEDQIEAFPQIDELAGEADGLEKTSGFLDAIEAGSSERHQLAAKAAAANLSNLANNNQLDVAAARQIHAWIAGHSPGGEDAVIGGAIASAIRSGRLPMSGESSADSASAVEIIEALHQESGADDLLLAFLNENVIASHPAESATLAARLHDPDRRNEMTERIRKLMEGMETEP